MSEPQRKPTKPRVDVDGLLAKADLVGLIRPHVQLKKHGKEYHGRCPFHEERTPSFTVAPDKGFFHCFGCGAHGTAIGWLMDYNRLTFLEACAQLGGESVAALGDARPVRRAVPERLREPDTVWVPLLPVPDEAPALLQADGRTCPVWNPKGNDAHPAGRFVQYHPSRLDEYRDAAGRRLGYVIRLDFRKNGKATKITPTITWCVGPDGVQQWCLRKFPAPRPLYGLDALAAKPDAPVLVVEGEKCRAAGADALSPYAVVSWPGGSKGIGYSDWSPLSGRDGVLWPDADQAGRDAMLGWIDRGGQLHRGVAQHAHRAGARSLRMVDPEGMPKGWDIYDALHGDEPWSPRQLATWASTRVRDIEVDFDPQRSAR